MARTKNYFNFSKKCRNFPFLPKTTPELSSRTALVADRTEMKCLKVKHDNCTKRPHIPRTEPQQGTSEDAEPGLAGLYGPISEVISKVWWPWPVKDIKIGTFTLVGFTWLHLPWPANPKQERNGTDYKRTVQDAGRNPQVLTYKLRPGKGLIWSAS